MDEVYPLQQLNNLKKVHRTTPVTVVQNEYSMMERKWAKNVIPLYVKN